MGRTHRHGRPEKEDRNSVDLKALERMRAPWFFDAEVQRRVRMGDPSRSASRWRRLKIAAAYFVLAACLVGAYLEFGDRLQELMPQSAPPIVPRGDTLATPPPTDTAKAAETAPVVATPRIAPMTLTPSVGDTARVQAADSARQDSVPPASPSQRDPIQEALPTDTTRHTEPQRSVPRPDTTLAQPDSLGRSRGTP
jgi:hypothetical protein